MKIIPVSSERWLEFSSPVQLRNFSMRTHARNPDRSHVTAALKRSGPYWLPRSEGEVAATLEAAELIRQHDGRREIRGGSAAEHAAVLEWGSLSRHEAAFTSEPLSPSVEQATARSARHKRILIADDDAPVRGSLAAVLESEGYEVDEAHDGIEAVSRAIKQAPNLVLLDLNMPNWDGWTAFSQLDRVTPLLPVIVITARPNQYEKAVRLGVDAFMEKPLSFPVLVRAIKQLTSEDEKRHVRRITNRAFVTQLLRSTTT